MNKFKSKKIWIDLENTPHVLFFRPIINELTKKQIDTLITVRDYSQVIELAQIFNLKFRIIGKHYGKYTILKIIGLFIRLLKLLPHIIVYKPDLAVSHGSRSQIILCYLLRIPSIVAFDYEYTSRTYLPPTYRIAPEALRSIKTNKHIHFYYTGLKENVYIHTFKKNAEDLNSLKIDKNKIIIVIRPPATHSHYYVKKSNQLFFATMDYLSTIENIQVIILPRIDEQKKYIIERWNKQIKTNVFLIPQKAINAINLLYFSDLVISGGGTMNREAAALNIPVYSIFAGTTGAVDKYLEKSNRLKIIRDENDIPQMIKICKRDKHKTDKHKEYVTKDEIVNFILSKLSNEHDS